jgi:hypothetical protein
MQKEHSSIGSWDKGFRTHKFEEVDNKWEFYKRIMIKSSHKPLTYNRSNNELFIKLEKSNHDFCNI